MPHRKIAVLLFLCRLMCPTWADCAMFNYCNGHGICNGALSLCECFEGYGAATDITLYRAPDCSALTCPSGRAWGDVPTAPNVAHALAECSNRGKCDRTKGICKCFEGFTGDACQRMACPNDCSGHGQCVSMSQMAQMANAFPLNNNTFYEGYEARFSAFIKNLMSWMFFSGFDHMGRKYDIRMCL